MEKDFDRWNKIKKVTDAVERSLMLKSRRMHARFSAKAKLVGATRQHPLAAVLLRRALIEVTLKKGRATRYKHAARHAHEIDA